MADERAKTVDPGAAASAVAPRLRRYRPRKNRDRPLTQCENCGAELHGHWCAQCGQAAIDYRRSLRHVIVDVLDSFLNWDSKFFATIGSLIARPWHLTNEFVAGRRVRYVHPLRLYLLASIIFFFVVNYWVRSIHVDPSRLSPEDRAEVSADLKSDPDVPPQVRARVEEALNRATPRPTQSALPSATPTASAPSVSGPLVKTDKAPSDSIGKWLEQRAKEKMGERGTKMGLFIATLFSNLPYMMLCCIPLFAFVLKILYLRRHIFYVDHLIYALHIHTFAYVGFMLIVLITIGLNRTIAGALAGWIIALLWLGFAVQILLSIRRVYRQGWLFSLFKFVIGGFAYLLVLGVALAATFLITLALPLS